MSKTPRMRRAGTGCSGRKASLIHFHLLVSIQYFCRHTAKSNFCLDVKHPKKQNPRLRLVLGVWKEDMTGGGDRNSGRQVSGMGTWNGQVASGLETGNEAGRRDRRG
ncbi:hypothetical protein PM082_008290 [Marasmius tenuissimus]|nr:hypothetical protein PM082_008290 [Marasmius tenuissimus]